MNSNSSNGARTLSDDTQQLLDRALREDRAKDDVTTRRIVPEGINATGRITAREPGVIAGAHLIQPLFDRLDQNTDVSILENGSSFEEGDEVAGVSGPARPLLSGERVALNFLQRLSGIATLTRSYVRKIDDLPADVVDTRKTTPGWRRLEKNAVRLGGGTNHRMHLAEMAIIKENHLAILRGQNQSLREVVNDLESSVEVQVEVESRDDLAHVLDAEPSLILIDNMSVRNTEQAVNEIRSYENEHDVTFRIEASGGIDLERVRPYARTGVDRISIGSLTHSAPAVDFSMNVNV